MRRRANVKFCSYLKDVRFTAGSAFVIREDPVRRPKRRDISDQVVSDSNCAQIWYESCHCDNDSIVSKTPVLSLEEAA